MVDDIKIRPRLAPPLPEGYQAPATPNLNTSEPILSSLNNVAPRTARDSVQPYARRDEANNFRTFDQINMRLVAWRERYAIITESGSTLDITNYSYFIIRSIGGGTFSIALPTPPVVYDAEGNVIREAWGITVDIEYTGSGAPSFSGARLPENEDPAWSSTAGKLDTVVLTWADRWLLRKASFGYQL